MPAACRASVCGVKGEGLAPLVSDASVHSSRAAIRAACATATSRLVLAPPPSPAAHSPATLLPTATLLAP